jgi:hypothetical protein
MSTTTTDVTVATKSLDERKELLARAVANEIRRGWSWSGNAASPSAPNTSPGPIASIAGMP